jgi:hypothetical protein
MRLYGRDGELSVLGNLIDCAGDGSISCCSRCSGSSAFFRLGSAPRWRRRSA